MRQTYVEMGDIHADPAEMGFPRIFLTALYSKAIKINRTDSLRAKIGANTTNPIHLYTNE